ncbi:MAG: histidine phosphatase family protein [Actinomycetes bacterium]
MELVFIRHSEPEWARDGLSVNDPPLTERGHLQAAMLADHLREIELEIDEIFVSPLIRAVQTAEPVLAALNLAPTTLPWLAEIAAPNWDGTPAEEVARIFADSRDRPIQRQWDGIPGGETFRDFHDRVTGGLQSLLDRAGATQISQSPALWKLEAAERRIAIVAHSGTNATALGHLLGIAPVPWEWERFQTRHASITRVEPMSISDAHAFCLSRLNDVDHLPPELRTR